MLIVLSLQSPTAWALMIYAMTLLSSSYCMGNAESESGADLTPLSYPEQMYVISPANPPSTCVFVTIRLRVWYQWALGSLVLVPHAVVSQVPHHPPQAVLPALETVFKDRLPRRGARLGWSVLQGETPQKYRGFPQ